MQLINTIEGPSGGGLAASATTSALSAQLQPRAVSSVTPITADAVQQVDLLITTANISSQTEVMVTVPVTPSLAVVNTSQLTTTAAAVNTALSLTAVTPPTANPWHAPHTSAPPNGTAAHVLKKQSSISGYRWNPMKSRCRHGSGVPPCSSCLRAGLGGSGGNR